MPPTYVKAYVKRNNTDAADAEAICEAVSRPTMRFVPIKTPAEQAACMVLRIVLRCRILVDVVVRRLDDCIAVVLVMLLWLVLLQPGRELVRIRREQHRWVDKAGFLEMLDQSRTVSFTFWRGRSGVSLQDASSAGRDKQDRNSSVPILGRKLSA